MIYIYIVTYLGDHCFGCKPLISKTPACSRPDFGLLRVEEKAKTLASNFKIEIFKMIIYAHGIYISMSCFFTDLPINSEDEHEIIFCLSS